MPINKKAIYQIVFYLIVFIFVGYLYIVKNISELEDKKYIEYSTTIKNKVERAIREKKRENLLLTFSLSFNENVKKIILTKNSNINLNDIIVNLAKYTAYYDIWFQLYNIQGQSVYTTWTTANRKKNEKPININNFRDYEVESVAGLDEFSMVFRTVIPIFKDKKLIGSIESILHFDSLVELLKKEGYSSLVLVDKAYKESLPQAIPDMFYEDYYVATVNPDATLLNYLHTHSVKEILNIKNYRIDKKNGLLLTKVTVLNKQNKNLGYILVAYPLDKIDMSDISQTRTMIIIIILFIIFIVSGLLYNLYVVKYKKFISKQNELLSTTVEEKTKTLQYLALHDPLTTLPNRVLLLDILEKNILEAKKTNHSIYVLFLDLDRFKEINDTYGHEIGDKLLMQVSKSLKEILDENVVVSRVSGDEFVVVLNKKTQSETIFVLDSIVLLMKRPFMVEHLELFVSFSIGISVFPEHGRSAKVLLREADTAMYISKKSGKDNYTFYSSVMTQNVLKRQVLGRDLRKALEQDEFEICYQPKIDVITGKVLGLESLLRWNHPTRGKLQPDEFMSLAEELGVMIQVDRYMRVKTFTQILKWQDEGIDTGVLSLNVSTKEIENKLFLENLEEAISDTGIKTKYLEIEVLENQIMQDMEHGIMILEAVKSLGVSISIDDFGTGYSSLSYLQRLPIDKVKIDRSFVENLIEDEGSQKIIYSIISLAKSLNLSILAEGVETKEQVNFLVEAGCTQIQGYYFSKPLSVSDCKNYLIEKQEKID